MQLPRVGNKRDLKAVGLASVTLLSLGACATSDDLVTRQEATSQDSASDIDPLEGANRVSYKVTMFVDRNALKPVAQAYKDVLPDPAREGVRNFLDNLNSPVVFVNNVLQGDIDGAGDTLARFFVNSTFGIGGFVDRAADWGVPADQEDFGITLGRWGVDDGPYLYLPILGPSSPRDAIGLVADYAFDPQNYLKLPPAVTYGLTAIDIIDVRASNITTTDDIERTSIDSYAAVRSLYRQARAAKVKRGKLDVKDLPNF